MPHSIIILKLMQNKQSHILLISVKSENNKWKKKHIIFFFNSDFSNITGF